jgi:chromosome segregation ATPase
VAVEETISTLTYAEQANGIQNKPVASSLLRVTRDPMSGDLSGTSSSCRTSTDWAEAEMKIMYLTQEVEEAQSALARKYQEMQELVDRAENAEQEMQSMKADVAQLQTSLSSSAAAHGRVTTSARTLISELHAACAASETSREREEKELASLRGQRYVEEQVIAGLQRQRQDLRSDVAGIQKELEGARAELLSSRSQMQELRSQTEQRCGDALQNIIQLATAEFGKIGHGVADSVEKACNKMDGVCGRLGCASELASAAETRCVGTGEKATDNLATWCKEFNAAHEKFYQSSTTSRKALEASTTAAKENAAECANIAELAAANASWAGERGLSRAEPVLKENSDLITPSNTDKKINMDNAGAQDVARVALKELN